MRNQHQFSTKHVVYQESSKTSYEHQTYFSDFLAKTQPNQACFSSLETAQKDLSEVHHGMAKEGVRKLT